MQTQLNPTDAAVCIQHARSAMSQLLTGTDVLYGNSNDHLDRLFEIICERLDATLQNPRQMPVNHGLQGIYEETMQLMHTVANAKSVQRTCSDWAAYFFLKTQGWPAEQAVRVLELDRIPAPSGAHHAGRMPQTVTA